MKKNRQNVTTFKTNIRIHKKKSNRKIETQFSDQKGTR